MTPPPPSSNRYDAVVVGARVAGAATAMLLARAGLRVLVVDRSAYGTDTTSTHALMRPAVAQLHRWGLLERLQATGLPAISQSTFDYGDERDVIPIRPRADSPALYAPRRTVLDRLLVDAAREAGVELAYGVRIADVLRADDGRVVGVLAHAHGHAPRAIHAEIVVGADGMRSTIARAVDATTYEVGDHATATVYGYFTGLDVHGYEWFFRPGLGAGLIPTHDGAHNVFASVSRARFGSEIAPNPRDGLLRVLGEAAPTLAARVAGATQVGKLRGHGGQEGFVRQPWGPGWALVGDAGYFRDPITAHGITDALRDAELLARAVVTGTAQAMLAYQRTRDDIATPMFHVSDRIASLDWALPTLRELLYEMSEHIAAEGKMLGDLEAPVTPGATRRTLRGKDAHAPSGPPRNDAVLDRQRLGV